MVSGLLGHFPFLVTLLDSEFLLGLAFVTITAAVVGFGVPGALVPISFSSGALLGGWFGVAVVVVGAAIGSQVLFVATRRWLSARVRARFGPRLDLFDHSLEKRGFFYLLGLRLLGVPHMLVTAASALSPIRARSFALATMLGLLPAITLAAMAGSAV
ncbi:MAG: VTT domain-containing protein [Croceibacterium sp.]